MNDQLLTKAAERIGHLTLENDLLRLEGEALQVQLAQAQAALAERVQHATELEDQLRALQHQASQARLAETRHRRQ